MVCSKAVLSKANGVQTPSERDFEEPLIHLVFIYHLKIERFLEKARDYK